MKIKKLEQVIKDELVALGFTKSKCGGYYEYKDISIFDFFEYNAETFVICYCDSKCDNNDMSYDTSFYTDMKVKEVRKHLQFIKDCQGELDKGYGCVWVNYPVRN